MGRGLVSLQLPLMHEIVQKGDHGGRGKGVPVNDLDLLASGARGETNPHVKPLYTEGTRIHLSTEPVPYGQAHLCSNGGGTGHASGRMDSSPAEGCGRLNGMLMVARRDSMNLL